MNYLPLLAVVVGAFVFLFFGKIVHALVKILFAVLLIIFVLVLIFGVSLQQFIDFIASILLYAA